MNDVSHVSSWGVVGIVVNWKVRDLFNRNQHNSANFLPRENREPRDVKFEGFLKKNPEI